MKRHCRKYAAAFKVSVAIAALQGDETLAALAEKFDVHPNRITQWNPMSARTKSSKASRARSCISLATVVSVEKWMSGE